MKTHTWRNCRRQERSHHQGQNKQASQSQETTGSRRWAFWVTDISWKYNRVFLVVCRTSTGVPEVSLLLRSPVRDPSVCGFPAQLGMSVPFPLCR